LLHPAFGGVRNDVYLFYDHGASVQRNTNSRHCEEPAFTGGDEANLNGVQIMKNFSAKTALLILFLLGLLTYGNALNHPFMIDDHAFFDEMDHRWGNLFLQFIPDKAKVLQLEGAKTEVYYRPLALVIPKIFYLAFGNKTYLFHISSLVLFVISGWMIFILTRIYRNLI
jgi:hypothetical protein